MIEWLKRIFRRARPLKDETPIARMARLNMMQTTVKK